MKDTFKIVDSKTQNTVLIRNRYISSIELQYKVDMIPDDDGTDMALDVIEVHIIMSNGREYIDNNYYIESNEIEYLK